MDRHHELTTQYTEQEDLAEGDVVDSIRIGETEEEEEVTARAVS